MSTGTALPVTGIDVHWVEVPLRAQWQIALYAARTRLHCIVIARGPDGLYGLGEVAPSPAFMGEDGRTCADVIARHLAPAVTGKNAFDLAQIHAAMDGAIRGHGSAKAAVDIAVHDLAARALGVPVSTLLGGRVRNEVPVTWVVSIQDISSAIDEMERFSQLGVSTFKLKLGRGPGPDLEFVRRVREAYPNVTLRADCNQGYTAHEALPLLRQLDAFGFDAIEQPVPAWDLDGMARLSQALDTPIMADECIFDLHQAAEVARRGAAGVFNVKVGKVGGLYRARQIAAVAEAFGISCTAGSNLELSIGTAASVHFAAATGVLTYASDLAIGHYLHEWDIAEPPLHIVDGMMTVPAGPGLGTELAPGLLEGRTTT